MPGFLWNRLQFALVREAFWLVEQGVATMEEVDLAIRQGLGRRWATAGPFASMDLGELDTFKAIRTGPGQRGHTGCRESVGRLRPGGRRERHRQ